MSVFILMFFSGSMSCCNLNSYSQTSLASTRFRTYLEGFIGNSFKLGLKGERERGGGEQRSVMFYVISFLTRLHEL
jgi:hypothetical protein